METTGFAKEIGHSSVKTAHSSFVKIVATAVLCNSLLFPNPYPTYKKHMHSHDAATKQQSNGNSRSTTRTYFSVYQTLDYEQTLTTFAEKMLRDTVDIDADVAQIINDHFWDLI